MKKFFLIVIITFLLSATRSFSQTINLPPDSIPVLLCKKWEADYAELAGMKISKPPGATEINYAFNKDNTFLMTSSNRKEATKGTWTYDSNKKIITLVINGKSNTRIISLKESEMVMLADTKDITPDDPKEFKLFYRVKGN